MINEFSTKILLLIVFQILIYGSFKAPLLAQDDPDRRIEEKEKQIKERRQKKALPKKQTKQTGKTQTATTDSTKKSSTPFAKRDTLITQDVNSQVFWYDHENNLKSGKDRINNTVFSNKDEKSVIYRNMSDIFRQQPFYYNYSMMSSGRPVYISAINSYPHQTSFYFNGILMNDPIHGMFNSQYIPLNFIRYVQLSSAANDYQDFGSGGTSSIHVISDSRHTKAPWSRIVYKQGNYGYTDLDISFVHPATPDLAVQIGGINREFDGSSIYDSRQGTNYRAELTWQIQSNLFLRSQMFLSRERVGMTALLSNLNSDPVFPKQIDLRDDYFIDVTWLPTDTITQRVHLQLFNTYSVRRLKDDNARSYHNRYQFKRYGLDANYNFRIKDFDFLAGGGLVRNRVWGTPFKKQYYPTYLNSYAKLKIPLVFNFNLKPQAQITLNEDFEPQLSIAAKLENPIDEATNISLGLSRSTRYPNATEKYFNFDSLYGNEKLVNEDHLAMSAELNTKLFSETTINLKTQYNFINNEIIFYGNQFINGPDRDFLVIAGEINQPFWKFNLTGGGFETFSNVHITSRRSAWGKLHYGDIWLNGALGVDAYATLQYWGEHSAIRYDPRMERFYRLNGLEDGFVVFNWKVVATVKDARIFFEMDNSFSQEYEVINQYLEFTQRWRFGVHWILWN